MATYCAAAEPSGDGHHSMAHTGPPTKKETSRRSAWGCSELNLFTRYRTPLSSMPSRWMEKRGDFSSAGRYGAASLSERHVHLCASGIQSGNSHCECCWSRRLQVRLEHFSTGAMMELWKPLGARPRQRGLDLPVGDVFPPCPRSTSSSGSDTSLSGASLPSSSSACSNTSFEGTKSASPAGSSLSVSSFSFFLRPRRFFWTRSSSGAGSWAPSVGAGGWHTDDSSSASCCRYSRATLAARLLGRPPGGVSGPSSASLLPRTFCRQRGCGVGHSRSCDSFSSSISALGLRPRFPGALRGGTDPFSDVTEGSPCASVPTRAWPLAPQGSFWSLGFWVVFS